MEQIKFHIGLNVSDITSTVRFYSDLFGQEPVKVKEDYAKFELDNPGLVISFIESKKKVAPQFGHLGLRVNSTKEFSEKKALIEQKLDIALEEQNTNCCSAHQNKFWVNDPDGYEWELYYLKEDIKKENKKYSAVSCC